MRPHNKFCYHECIIDSERLMKREFELYEILNSVFDDKQFREKVMNELIKIQMNLFHIRAGHGQI